MKQNDFIRHHEEFWQRLEHLLQIENMKNVSPDQMRSLPSDYRKVCHHLSLAKLRNYSPALQHRLNHIALKGYQLFYSNKAENSSRLGRLFSVDFPQCVRQHKYYLLVSAILFFVPLFAMLFGVIKDPNLAYTVVDPETADKYKTMYEYANDRVSRTSADDLMMFGFYIYNNISIALRTFASGLVIGIGAIFTLLLNGLQIGTVAGIVASSGYGENFFSFVVGHGAFELTAIVLAGACGMKLGFALLMPGRFTRGQALRNAARQTTPMIYGFVMMLFLAAAIEAFWSPSRFVPSTVKYWVGGLLWLAVILYFLFAGRHQTPHQ